MWQLGQARAAVERGSLQLAAVLAQLRLDVGEAQQPVELGLGGARARAAARVLEQPVLGGVQAAAHRPLAQRRVVPPRAREVLQEVAQLAGRGDADVHGDAGVGPRLRPRAARRGHALDLIQRGEPVRQRGGPRGGRDQVQVLDRVGLAARGSGELHVRAAAAALAQARDQRLADRDRLGEHDARRGALGHPVPQRREHVRLELGTEPAHGAQALGQGGLSQRARRIDAEL